MHNLENRVRMCFVFLAIGGGSMHRPTYSHNSCLQGDETELEAQPQHLGLAPSKSMKRVTVRDAKYELKHGCFLCVCVCVA